MIDLFHLQSGGAGFLVRIPSASSESGENFSSAVIEGQLLLNVLIGSQAIRTVDDFITAAVEHAKDIVGFTNAQRLIFCFDNREYVTGAKKQEQQRRTEVAQKSLTARKIEVYTQEDLDAFFVRSPAGSEDLQQPKTTDSALPSLERLRASKGGSKVLARAKNLLIDAVRAANFVHADTSDVRGNVELMFVYDGVVEHGHQKRAEDGTWNWSPLQFDGNDAPRGIGEAEELVAFYALQEPYTGDRVFVRCSDTDVLAILALGLRRMRNKQRKIFLDMNPGKSFDKTFGPPPAPLSEAEEAKLKKRKFTYPRCMEVVEATRGFLEAAARDEALKNYADPLLTVIFVCCLGGSDNVQQLPRMSGEAWLKALRNAPEAAQWLARCAVFAEAPLEVEGCDFDAQPLRTFLQEHGAVDEFVAHLFALTLSGDVGKKYQAVSNELQNEPAAESELQERLAAMLVDSKQALEARQAKADKDYERKLQKYNEAEAEKEPEEKLAPDGTVLTSAADKKGKAEPKRTQCVAFMPIDLQQVRGRIRRAHWQLQKILNGVVESGTPKYDEQREGKSVWGWSAESGSICNDVVPWSNAVQLF